MFIVNIEIIGIQTKIIYRLNALPTCRRKKLDPYLSSCIKIKSKYNQDLNLKPETLKLL